MQSAFLAFITLLVISVVVSAILHYALNYYATGGTASFLSKVVVGYVGGWLSPWILGDWFPAVSIAGVDVIAAIVGTTALLVVAVDIGKMLAPAAGSGGSAGGP